MTRKSHFESRPSEMCAPPSSKVSQLPKEVKNRFGNFAQSLHLLHPKMGIFIDSVE